MKEPQKEEKAPATEKKPVALPPVIAKHDFTNLQRLAAALENFNYPENTATTITVWRQGGGKGTSAQVADAKTLDVAEACHLIVDVHEDKEVLDLEKVAVVSADGTTIRFVNIKEEFAANRPFGLNVNRGELVIVLQLRKD